LKAKRKGKKLEVLEAAKEGIVEDITMIESNKNHYAIINKYGEVLGYWYHIKLELLETLSNSTLILPHKKKKAGV